MDHVRQVLIGLGLGAAALSASATTIDNGAAFEYVTGGIRITDGPGAGTFIGRNFEPPNTTARTIGINDTLRLPHVSREIGKPVTAVVARTLTMGALATAVGQVAGAGMIGYEIGTGIAKLLGLGDPSNGTRIVPTASGWQFDEGQATVGTFTYTIPRNAAVSGATGVFAGGSAQSVCEAYASAYAAERTRINNGSPGYAVKTVTATDTACSASYNLTNGGTANSGPAPVTKTTTQSCPAYIDPFDSRLSRPAGDAPGPDGKCAAGRYQPALPTLVEERVRDYGNPGGMQGTIEKIIEKGGTIPGAGPRTVVDVNPPSEISSPQTTTTTNADGSTTTTTKTPTTTYVKSGDSITYNQSFQTVTQTCTASGSCTSSTTTTTTPSTTKTTDEKDQCTLNPDTAGCAKLGEAGGDKPERKTLPFGINPVDFGGQGTCPAPVPFGVFGQSLSFAFTPICDALTFWVRPVVLALAVAMAAFIFTGGLKS